MNAVLFWGCVGAVAGILGQFHGLYQAAKAISRAGALSPQIIWGGVAVSFTSTLAGIAILLLAALAWGAMRVRCTGGCGRSEYEGARLSEPEGIRATKALLERKRDAP
ncbi:MAG: hypothetical protein R6X22_11510 [Gemmatimonadota bacterium]